jgi:hypothetical protein
MEKSFLQKLFIFEILTTLLVPLIFKWIEPKKIAALFAGGLFVVLGVTVIYGCFKYKSLRFSVVMLLGAVHLFGLSLPMLGMRLYHFDLDFEKISIFGMKATDYHHYSVWVFFALMIATFFEWLRIVWKKKYSKTNAK